MIFEELFLLVAVYQKEVNTISALKVSLQKQTYVIPLPFCFFCFHFFSYTFVKKLRNSLHYLPASWNYFHFKNILYNLLILDITANAIWIFFAMY